MPRKTHLHDRDTITTLRLRFDDLERKFYDIAESVRLMAGELAKLRTEKGSDHG